MSNTDARREERRPLNLGVLNDTEFQKEIRPNHVKYIYDHFNPDLFKEIEVAFYDDKFLVWDGQTRKRVAEMRGETEIMCNIKFGRTYAEIVTLFLEANSRKTHAPTKPIEKYRAALCIPECEIEEAAKNNETIRLSVVVKGILEKHNIELFEGGRVNKNGEYSSAYCPETLFYIARERGEDNLDKTCYVLVNGFAKGTGQFQADIIMAVSTMIHEADEAGRKLYLDGLISRFLETTVKEITLDAIQKRSARVYKTWRPKLSDVYRDLFVKMYNEKRKKSEQLPYIRKVG